MNAKRAGRCEIVRGNLLAADVDALVNAVNTAGVMGKGIALQFRRAFPPMFEAYRADCRAGRVRLGCMHVYEVAGLCGPRWIINFPTKAHWRTPSRLRDIEAGLADLVATIRRHRITSVALPPLGCGNGGLSWDDVRPRIEGAFGAVPEVRALLFAPSCVTGGA